MTEDADQIITEFDELNALWKAADDALWKLKVPREVQVQAGDGLFLGWAKTGGRWRCCASGHLAGSDKVDVGWRPVLEVRLEDRVRLAHHLAVLKQKLLDARGVLHGEVTAAAEAIRKALEDEQ